MKFLLVTAILSIHSMGLTAQHTKIHKSGRYVVNSIFMIIDSNNWLKTSSEIENKYHESNEYSFFLFNGSILSNDSIQSFLNNQINYTDICKYHMHLMVVGDRKFIENKDVFDPDIFASVSKILKEENKNYIDFQNVESLTLDDFIERTNNNYTWEYIINDIKSKHAIDLHKHSGSTEFYFKFQPTFLFSSYENYHPNSINAYSFGLNRKTSSRFSVYGGFGFSLKLPKPPDDIQSLVMGQIDLNEVLNGEAGEEEIDLSLSISGHIYTKLGFGIGYRVFSNKNASLSFKTGISRTQFIGIEERIDTTFVVDLSEFSPGSSIDLDGFSPEDLQNENDLDLQDNLISTISIPINLTGEVPLSPRFLLTTELNFELDKCFFSNENHFNQLNIGFGLKYNFKRPAKNFFEYIRLKPKVDL